MIQLYSVSRETLREAIRLLEVQGLLSIRRGPGGGPRVTAVNPAYLARAASLYFHVVGATYGEVFDAWAALEPAMVGRVAAHPDRDAVAAAMAPYLATATATDPQAAIEMSATLHSDDWATQRQSRADAATAVDCTYLDRIDAGSRRPQWDGGGNPARPPCFGFGDRER